MNLVSLEAKELVIDEREACDARRLKDDLRDHLVRLHHPRTVVRGNDRELLVGREHHLGSDAKLLLDVARLGVIEERHQRLHHAGIGLLRVVGIAVVDEHHDRARLRKADFLKIAKHHGATAAHNELHAMEVLHLVIEGLLHLELVSLGHHHTDDFSLSGIGLRELIDDGEDLLAPAQDEEMPLLHDRRARASNAIETLLKIASEGRDQEASDNDAEDRNRRRNKAIEDSRVTRKSPRVHRATKIIPERLREMREEALARVLRSNRRDDREHDGHAREEDDQRHRKQREEKQLLAGASADELVQPIAQLGFESAFHGARSLSLDAFKKRSLGYTSRMTIAPLTLHAKRIEQLLTELPQLDTGSRLIPEVGEWIETQARDLWPSRLVIRLPASEHEKALPLAHELATHFRAREQVTRMSQRKRVREGLASARIGLVFLVFVLVAAQASAYLEVRLPEILSEGFSVLGWVALWRPTEELLYGWFPLRRALLLQRKLATIEVVIESA